MMHEATTLRASGWSSILARRGRRRRNSLDELSVPIAVKFVRAPHPSFGCELRGKPPRASPESKKGVRSTDPGAYYAKRDLVEGSMRHPLDRADHYRKEAVKCHELAKHAQPAYLGDFYRRIAVRYMFMAEDLLNEARARGDAAHRAIIARGGASAEI
jgi:hypothetical protein